MNVIRQLRERIDYLEEENRQLREELAPQVALPRDWRLTGTEEKLFRHLIGRPVLTRASLMVALYADRPAGDVPSAKCLDVFVFKLRQKLAPHGVRIDTVWRTGFRLAERERYQHLRKRDK